MKMKNIQSIFSAVVMMAAVACSQQQERPEITWSLMHPTHLDTVYMAKVIANLPGHPVDNFEVCGGCNAFNDGSLDGLLYFEEYPLAAACQNVAQVDTVPSASKLTILGVKYSPKAFGTSWHLPFSHTDTKLLVVPKSIPIIFPIYQNSISFHFFFFIILSLLKKRHSNFVL